MPVLKDKVFCYITRDWRLLLLEHPHHPEAGIQVPAGTMRTGADVLAEAMREAREETGLANLKVVGTLGDVVFDARPYGRDELHHRTFVHLCCREETPARWQH